MEKLKALVALGTNSTLKERLGSSLPGDIQLCYTYCINGQVAYRTFLRSKWDLLVINEDLPLLPGFELTRKIRRQNEQIPLVFLKDQGNSTPAYRAGADIVLASDFHPEIFSLQTAALLKRSMNAPVLRTCRFGTYTFSLSSATITSVDGNLRIRLTSRQAELFHFLLVHANHTLHRPEILRTVWQKDSYFNGRSMDVLVAKLRKSLCAIPELTIHTVHGIGLRVEIRPSTGIDIGQAC